VRTTPTSGRRLRSSSRLKAGGFIELAQYGTVVQPFGMGVWPAWEGEAAAAAARLEDVDV
jgi:hypothetical protein